MTETFGAMLKRLRHEIGLSQTKLARASGLDPAYVMHLERGTRGGLTGRDVVMRLAYTLGLNPPETDRFLHAAGLSTVVDWQDVAESLMRADPPFVRRSA